MQLSVKLPLLVLAACAAMANAAFTTSPSGVDFIAGEEGFRANYYRDVGGLWTIGYGHLCGKTQCAGIKAPISVARGKQILRGDLHIAESCVNRLPDLTQDRFDALVSFAFNLGCGVFPGSTISRDLAAHNVKGAAASMLQYDHVGSTVVEGLKLRREAEVKIFCKSGGC